MNPEAEDCGGPATYVLFAARFSAWAAEIEETAMACGEPLDETILAEAGPMACDFRTGYGFNWWKRFRFHGMTRS